MPFKPGGPCTKKKNVASTFADSPCPWLPPPQADLEPVGALLVALRVKAEEGEGGVSLASNSGVVAAPFWEDEKKHV